MNWIWLIVIIWIVLFVRSVNRRFTKIQDDIYDLKERTGLVDNEEDIY